MSAPASIDAAAAPRTAAAARRRRRPSGRRSSCAQAASPRSSAGPRPTLSLQHQRGRPAPGWPRPARRCVAASASGDRAVLDEHHLVGAPGLVVHGGREGAPQEGRVVAAPTRASAGENGSGRRDRRPRSSAPARLGQHCAVRARAGAQPGDQPAAQRRARRVRPVRRAARTCAPSVAAVEPPYSSFSGGAQAACCG